MWQCSEHTAFLPPCRDLSEFLPNEDYYALIWFKLSVLQNCMHIIFTHFPLLCLRLLRRVDRNQICISICLIIMELFIKCIIKSVWNSYANIHCAHIHTIEVDRHFQWFIKWVHNTTFTGVCQCMFAQLLIDFHSCQSLLPPFKRYIIKRIWDFWDEPYYCGISLSLLASAHALRSLILW